MFCFGGARYVLATAKRLKVKILTGHMHFKGIKEAVLLK